MKIQRIIACAVGIGSIIYIIGDFIEKASEGRIFVHIIPSTLLFILLVFSIYRLLNIIEESLKEG